MMITKTLYTYFRDETAAVSLDWVVLTAAITGLGVAFTADFTTEWGNFSTKIGNAVANAPPASGAQCPSNWQETLINDYGADQADIDADVALYGSMTDDDLAENLATYTDEGGFGIETNEDNVQAIICEMDTRDIETDVRAF